MPMSRMLPSACCVAVEAQFRPTYFLLNYGSYAMVTGLISLCVAGTSQEANFVNVLREFITSLRPVDPWEFFKYRNIFLSTNEPDPGHVSKSFSPKHVKAQTKSNFTSIHCRPPGSATHLRRQFGCPAICNR